MTRHHGWRDEPSLVDVMPSTVAGENLFRQPMLCLADTNGIFAFTSAKVFLHKILLTIRFYQCATLRNSLERAGHPIVDSRCPSYDIAYLIVLNHAPFVRVSSRYVSRNLGFHMGNIKDLRPTISTKLHMETQ